MKPIGQDICRFARRPSCFGDSHNISCRDIRRDKFQNNYQYVAKSIGACKKKTLYNQPKPFKKIFFYCEVIFGYILTNFTPKHSELSMFWLFIYSWCCYEWFLFVHHTNSNTANKNWLWFSYIFQQKINPKN